MLDTWRERTPLPAVSLTTSSLVWPSEPGAPLGQRARATGTFCAAATALTGLMRLRRPSVVLSAVVLMISITSAGFSLGFTARILAARLAVLGEAMEVPDIFSRSPPGT